MGLREWLLGYLLAQDLITVSRFTAAGSPTRPFPPFAFCCLQPTKIVLVADGDQQPAGWIPRHVDPHRPTERLSRAAREDPEAQTQLCRRVQTHQPASSSTNQKVCKKKYFRVFVSLCAKPGVNYYAAMSLFP